MFLNNSVKKIRNKEKGKRAFVLANGPSVLDCDLSKLDKEDVLIGVNAASVLQDRFDVVLDYYCVSDARFLTHPEKYKFATDYIAESTICVFRRELKDLVPDSNNLFFINSIGRDGFSFNVHSGYFFGTSTTHMAIQLAAYLGCYDIYLLGVDLKYKSESPRFYNETAPQIEEATIGVQINNLILARKALLKKGIELKSCSPRSFTRPYIPFARFEELF